VVIILVMSVCRSFESLDVQSIFLLIRYIFGAYGSGLYMDVIRSRSRSREQKMCKIIPTPLSLSESMTKTATSVSALRHWWQRANMTTGNSACHQCWIIQGHWCTMNIHWLTLCNRIHAFAGGLL